MWPNAQVPGDLVRLTEEIINGKNFIFCAVFAECVHYYLLISDYLSATDYHKILTLPAPIPDKERKLTTIFIFTLLFGA